MIDLAAKTVPTHRLLLQWAADAVSEGASPGPGSLGMLAHALARAARQPPPVADALPQAGSPSRGVVAVNVPEQVEGPSWQYARRLAELRLPPDLRDARRDELASIELTEEQRVVARALAALADAAANHRATLDEAAVQATQAMLALPLEARRTETEQVSRRHLVFTSDGNPLLSGRDDAAEQAIPYLAQLGAGAPDAIFRIARKTWIGRYERIYSRLVSLGYEDPEPLRWGQRLRNTLASLPNPREGWDMFFRAAASVSDTPGGTTRAERWRMPALAALFDALGVYEASVHGIADALTRDQAQLPGWLRAVARALGIDLPSLARQAVVALAIWEAGDRLLEMLIAPANGQEPSLDSRPLDREDVDALVDALTAASDWLADIAVAVLLDTHDPDVGEAVELLLPALPPLRRRLVAALAVRLALDAGAAADRLLAGDDPASRTGAAQALNAVGSPDSALSLRAARGDPDMAVRLAAGADQTTAESARYWSCSDCGASNEMVALDCTSCDTGARPGRHV
jgi:hypothetical protein